MATSFLECSRLKFFLSKKFRRMKQGQNNKYDITNNYRCWFRFFLKKKKYMKKWKYINTFDGSASHLTTNEHFKPSLHDFLSVKDNTKAVFNHVDSNDIFVDTLQIKKNKSISSNSSLYKTRQKQKFMSASSFFQWLKLLQISFVWFLAKFWLL